MEEPGDPFGGNRASQLVPHETVRPKTVVVETLPPPARLYARALSGIVKRGRPAHLPALRLVRPAVALEPGPAYAASFPSTACHLRIRICSRFRCTC